MYVRVTANVSFNVYYYYYYYSVKLLSIILKMPYKGGEMKQKKDKKR